MVSREILMIFKCSIFILIKVLLGSSEISDPGLLYTGLLVTLKNIRFKLVKRIKFRFMVVGGEFFF